MSYRTNISAILAAITLTACGSPGESEPAACTLCGDLNDIIGSIRSKTGSQSEMESWAIAAIERDTGIARVGEIDSAGLYTLTKLRTDMPQTLALLSPDYILTAVLSIASTTPGAVNQFIEVGKPNLPLLINSGTILEFQNFEGLTVTKDLAADADGDLEPDGMVSISGQNSALRGFGLQGFDLQGATPGPQPVDTDTDGNLNATDPDIDGDGLVNWLDSDDNGNGIRDVFDGDANGDLQNDKAPGANNTDLYFKEGVEYIAVQFEMAPKEDGSGNVTTLKFTTKVRDEVVPDAIQIRGAPSLIKDATYKVKDEQGNETVQAWNQQLFDDGNSDDGNPGDRIFAKRIDLAEAKSPRFFETIFFELAFGGESRYYVDFPYIFPDLKPSPVTAQYNAATRMVILLGNPFGPNIQDYSWVITVFNADGKNIWQSESVPATTRTFQIQENILVAGQTYKYSVAAMTLDKVPGYPAYTIHSKKYDVK